MYYYNIIILLMVLNFCVSCKSGKHEDGVQKADVDMPQENRGGVVDGRDWTLAKLSDSFDEGMTLASALDLYGEGPVIVEDDGFTMVTYSVDSDDLYVNGVRTTTIDLIFVNSVLENARINFTVFEDL